MKTAVLGKKYDLSVAFVPGQKIRELNRAYRKKDSITDILSFPLSETEGEIFIAIPEARRQAKKFGRPLKNFMAFLFIHGLAHLKGFKHGSKMEALEAGFRKEFGI